MRLNVVHLRLTLVRVLFHCKETQSFYAIVSEPTSDTDRMMNEVGALVHDLQTMGDMAVSKWKN